MLERIVRHFVVIDSAPINREPPKPVTVLDDEPPAYIEWGAPSEFIPPNRPTGPVSVTNEGDTIVNADLTDIEQRLQNIVNLLEQQESLFDDPIRELTEEARTTETVRVYNPEEAALVPNASERQQWVDVERITSITFRAADGSRWRYALKHDEAAP